MTRANLPAASDGRARPPRSRSIVGVLTPTRRHVYHVLLCDPGRQWTVRGLATAATAAKETAVRDCVNLLLAEKIVEQVPRQRALTVRLTEHGRTVLPALLRDDGRT